MNEMKLVFKSKLVNEVFARTSGSGRERHDPRVWRR